MKQIDILVDGPFILEQKKLRIKNLKALKKSKNDFSQKNPYVKNKVILYDED
ncbi:MAG: hypothetical protein L6U99_02725 [Clostridium sp.]|nr:MAG: hypothetical protein L6U99_02725 [Clostridium sp.]